MIVITDSNIFYSALISSESLIYRILTERSKIQFIAPDFIIEEIHNHLTEISEFKNVSENKVKRALHTLLENVTVFNSQEISKEYVRKAVEITYDIDVNDAIFIALHFQTKHKIWTGDKQLISGLKSKGYDICISTQELKKYLYK